MPAYRPPALEQALAGERQKAAVELALLAARDRLHGGLGIIISHPHGYAVEEGEGTVAGVEHPLLRFAGIGAKVGLAAVRETEAGGFYYLRHCAENGVFAAPVELAGVTRGKHQGNKGVMVCAGTLRLPLLYETLDAAAGVGIALSLKIFE